MLDVEPVASIHATEYFIQVPGNENSTQLIHVIDTATQSSSFQMLDLLLARDVEA